MKKHIPFLVTILCTCLAVAIGFAHYSRMTDYPFYAWRESTGELLAYNAQGEAQILLTGVQRHNDYQLPYSYIQVDSQRMLAVLKVNDVYGLYKLDGHAATLLDPLAQIKLNDFVYKQLPYVVMDGQDGNFHLINVDTGASSVVPDGSAITSSCYIEGYGQVWQHCVRISKDATKLRYFMPLSSSTEKPVWTLVERDLTTGKEHQFFKVDSNTMPDSTGRGASTECTPDKYGDRWICHSSTYSADGCSNDFYLVFPDGHQQMILENSQWCDADQLSFGYDDELVVSNVACNDDCHFDLYPADGEPPYRFYLKRNTGGYFTLFRRFPNGRIFLDTGGYYASIVEHAEPVDAGYYFCCEAYDAISPDRRWLVSNTDDGIFLWDMEAGKRIMQFKDMDYLDFFKSNFLNYGLIIRGKWVYRYGDDAPLNLPEQYTGSYFDILADRTLLYFQHKSDKSLSAGIYRYNPVSNTMSLLLADAQPVTQWSDWCDWRCN